MHIVDPERAFGQPTFIRGGARLKDVHDRIYAGEDERAVTEDYGVSLPDIRAAIASARATAA